MKPSSTNNTEPSLELPIPVATALTRFASTVRKWSVLEAFGWLAAYLLLGFTLLAAADRFLRLTHLWRLSGAAGIYLGGTALISILLLRAFRRQTALGLAKTLETRATIQGGQPFEERISTTVELATGGHAIRGFASGMIQRVADEAANQIAAINVTQLADRSGAKQAYSASTILFITTLVLCALPRWEMPTFYLRVAFPWMNLERPGRTRVRAQTGSTTVVEGQVLLIEALTQGEPVTAAQVETRQNGSPWKQLAMDHDPNDETRFTLPLGPLHEPLEYRVSAGDGISPVYHVPVLPRPEVTGLRLTIHYPEYTGLPAQTYQRLSGDLALLEGSEVELTATSNTPLTAAVLSFGDDRQLSMTVEENQARTSFEVTKDVRYRIKLRSKNGVSNPDAPLFFIQALADRTPQITIIHPKANEQADAQAILPLEIRAEDDLGIVGMQLVIRTGFRSETNVIPLEKPYDSGTPGKVWLVTRPWDLAGLFLAEGESVSFYIEAFDAAGATGKSDERRIRIVSGRPRTSSHAGVYLHEVHRRLATVNALLRATLKYATSMRQVFRPEDPQFQSADRTLFKDSLASINRELKTAALLLVNASPLVHSEEERGLCAGLRAALLSFTKNDLELMDEAAQESCASNPTQIATGLDLLTRHLTKARQTLDSFQSAATAAFRYARAQEITARHQEIHKDLKRIAPILVGASGWTSAGVFMPGLLLERFSSTSYRKASSRSVVAGIDNNRTTRFSKRLKTGYVRWSGEMLAPKNGRYVFQVSPGSSINMTIGKKIVVNTRTSRKRKASKTIATPKKTEGSIELTKGWHPFSVKYALTSKSAPLVLRRSGPDEPLNRIPNSHLRTSGPPSAPHTLPTVRTAMAQAASKAVVLNALIRMRTLLESTRSLPPQSHLIAALKPQSDQTGLAEALAWQQETDLYTTGMERFDIITPALAHPLMDWLAHDKRWVTRYGITLKRYRDQMRNWSKHFSGYRFRYASLIKQIDLNAQEASSSLKKSALISKDVNKQANAENLLREQAFLNQSLRQLSQLTRTLSDNLKQGGDDPHRPLFQRQILNGIQKRVQEELKKPAKALSKKEAATPAASAQTQADLSKALATLKQNAGNLAAFAEKNEKRWALEEALKSVQETVFSAQKALRSERLPTRRASILQANEKLKQQTKTLKHALDTTKGLVPESLWREASNVALHLKQKNHTKELLAETKPPDLTKQSKGSGKTKKPDLNSDSSKPNKALVDALRESERKATAIRQKLNHHSAQQARDLNGNYHPALKAAAHEAGEVVKALNQLKVKYSEAETTNAISHMKNTLRNTRQALSKASLQSQALHQITSTPAQQKQARQLTRIAVALKNEHDKKLLPLKTVLNEMQTDPERSALFFPEVLEQAQAVAKNLKFLSTQSTQVKTPTPTTPAESKTALEKFLAQQPNGPTLSSDLQKAQDLSDAAADIRSQMAASNVDKPAENTTEKPPHATPSDTENYLKSNAIQAALDLDDKTIPLHDQALSKELSALGKELKAQSKREVEADQLRNRAELALSTTRNMLTSDAPRLGRLLNELGRKTALLAETEKSRSIKKNLAAAQAQLPKTSRAIRELAREAESGNPIELAKSLASHARDLRDPLNHLTASLQKATDPRKEKTQQIGSETRKIAGQLTDMSDAFSRAQRANRSSNHTAKNITTYGKQLELRTEKMLQLLSQQNSDNPNQPRHASQINAAQKLLMKSTGPTAQRTANNSRSRATRMKKLSSAMQNLSAALRGNGGKPRNKSNIGTHQHANSHSQGLSKNHPAQAIITKARRGLAQAQIARETGAHARARTLAMQAADQLETSSNMIRDQLTTSEYNQHPDAPSSTPGDDPEIRASQPTPKDNKLIKPTPIKRPQHAILNEETWNRLPDSLKKDLLNTASDRFPSEYEASIRRYFKSIAKLHDQQDKGSNSK